MAVGAPSWPRSARVLARLAVLFAAAAVVVALLVANGGRALAILTTGLVGLLATVVGAWWALAHRGAVRWMGVALGMGAPVAVIVFYARWGLWSTAVGALLLCAATIWCAHSALRRANRPHVMQTMGGRPPQHPVLIMNPKSGGGKVDHFGLVDKAERLGARVILLDTSVHEDVGALARQAVAEGADLLGVAGGDGTQALVAEVAADHDVPFLVVSAGTRNHFAMDLGLDRADPSRCLDALTDGEEVRVDLGTVAGHPFVNTVSFGAYAQIVQDPAYRDAKTDTALDALPDLLIGTRDRLDARADNIRLAGRQAVLVSNNPYTAPNLHGAGRRPRLDTGTLGVLALRVENTAGAVDVALRGPQAPGMSMLTARRVVVHGEAGTIPVAVDGEALRLPTPVVCTVRQGALRVRVPKNRPGAPPPAAPLDWRRILTLAFGRPSQGPDTERHTAHADRQTEESIDA